MSSKEYRFSIKPQPITPIIKKIIIINVFMFFIITLFKEYNIFNFFAFNSNNVLKKHKLWQLFSYAFVHPDILQLLFNSLMLWTFGSKLENKWGSKFFLKYCSTIIIATSLISLFALKQNVYLYSNSNIVLGLLFAFALYYPNNTIYVMFIFPMKMKWFAMILVGINLIITKTTNDLTFLIHLTGIIAGFLILQLEILKAKIKYNKSLFNSSKNKKEYNNKIYKKNNSYNKSIKDYKFHKIPKKNNVKKDLILLTYDEELLNSKVDKILEKIKNAGMNSLSNDEKNLLNIASSHYKKQPQTKKNNQV